MDRPKLYAKHNILQKRDNEYTLDTYSKLVRWKKCPKILDLGCGDGTTTLEVLEPRVPADYVKLLGSDLQEKMVNFAKKANTKSKVDFLQLDIATEKILPDQYDHIFSFFTFHWVANLRRGFKNTFDMLSPGGDILINLVGDIPYYDLVKELLDHPVWASYFSKTMVPPFHSCKDPVKTLSTLLKDIGFKNVKIFSEERTFYYDSWVDCLKSLLALDPIISKLDAEQRQEYIVDYFFILKDTFGNCEEANGTILMPYNLLVVYASKPEDVGLG